MLTAVERAIMSMWENYKEPLSLADIADSAILSPFHFSRVFRGATGVPPGRFLAAIRIYEAKRLLLTTSLSVTHISFEVGYNSLGTFTRRFTESVGISPARFRRMHEGGVYELPGVAPGPSGRRSTVTGSVGLSSCGALGRVYLGTFDTPIAQGQPSSCDIIDITPAKPRARFRLTAVPEGEWFVQAVAIMTETGRPEADTRRCMRVGGVGPVKVVGDEIIEADIRLRPRQLTDLPVLLALPDIDSMPELDSSPLAAAARRPQTYPVRGQASPGRGRTRLRPAAAASGRPPGREPMREQGRPPGREPMREQGHSAGRQPARVESMRHAPRKVNHGLRPTGEVVGI